MFENSFLFRLSTSGRRVGDILILDLDGWLIGQKNLQRLEDVVKDLVSKGYKKILLNMQNVGRISTDGFDLLIKLSSILTYAARGELKTVNFRRPLMRLIQEQKLDLASESYDNEPAAVRSFK